ncbi:MAG: UDP-glucose/GDP-mannose dehydrogenase family protein [Bradymonadales bacterium]|jgi:UDPglucose 6-dehydrogenase
MQVIVIGVGYVGLNTAAALAYLGHDVLGIDNDAKKVAMLQNRRPPISEEGLEELLALDLKLKFSQELAVGLDNADVIFIAVGTPSREDGSANIDYVYDAARELGQKLKPSKDQCIVLKSTVPIGVNEHVESLIRKAVVERGYDDALLHFASSPEFLREGRALSDTFYPDRILIGTDDDYAFNILEKLYKRIISRDFAHPSFLEALKELPNSQIIRSDRVSAEMIKYASNAFLALKISFINEISVLCEALGADVNDVSKGMGLDRRIAPYFLKAGLGWGGSCFPKDTLALMSMAEDYGIELPLIEGARRVNEEQLTRVVRKVQAELKTLAGKKIAVLGISFKPLTDDVRNSPAVDLAMQLRDLGADVFMHDPVGVSNARAVYGDTGLHFCDSVQELCTDSVCSILATDWNEYRRLDFADLAKRTKQPIMVDARNFLDRDTVEESGWYYLGFGR